MTKIELTIRGVIKCKCEARSVSAQCWKVNRLRCIEGFRIQRLDFEG